MKKVLFITFFWPPSGKASLHWPLDIIKYLTQFEIKPSVLTVNKDTFGAKDESLLNKVDSDLEVIKTGYFDPFKLYRKFTGKSEEEPLSASEAISKTNKSLAHRISIWIRMNLFVPDARIGWYFHGIKSGTNFLRNNKVDAIITMGPPHSTHLIGKTLSKKFNLPHIPVLIDPWVDIVYYKDFERNKFTLALDNHFEKSVMQNAAKVIFVTKDTRNDFVEKYPFLKNKSEVLFWGFDEEEFKGIEIQKSKDEEVLVHAGNIFDYQNPENLWKTLKERIDSGIKFKIKFIGTVSPKIKQAISESGLNDFVEYSGFLPYKKMLSEISSASYLLVCATEKRHVPGKLFEYLRTGKPVLAFGDDNEEVNQILQEANAGKLFPYESDAKEFFAEVKSYSTKFETIEKYKRENIAKELARIIDPKK